MRVEGQASLSSDLAGRIRIEILTEQLLPGAKITEQHFSDKYGVSRTPVREALRNLEAEGLVEMIPNRGAFIIGLSARELKDLFTLRMSSEMQAVRWATLRRSKEEMEAIEESMDFMEFYTERLDAKRMRSINAGFHHRIAVAAHNRILSDTLTRMQEYIRYSARILPYREADLPEILLEHRGIFAAMQSGDPEAGAAAMQKHIENSLLRTGL
ncbi:MAG: GntR family transcriptional regulator [Clostridiales Family XIII bacterium]|jgi:DNA-binding GntR family transcriptional regulator|nr:GntR family transcriptional regulator [Clostridiales Family XIII bacterium]